MTISLPKQTINILPGINEISNAPQKVLIIGQKTSAGSATTEVLVQNILNDGSESALFGANSNAAEMVRAYKKVNPITRLDVIPVDDSGGSTAATGTFTVTGPATATGELVITTGSSKNYAFTIVVTSGDSATVIGDAIEAAVNANTNAPVTAANVAGVVTMTAVNAGSVGNFIGLRSQGTVAGVTVTVAGMSSGAGDSFPTTVFDQIENERYQTIIATFGFVGATNLTDFLDTRFNSDNVVLDGVGIITDQASFATLVIDGNANDSESLVIVGNQAVSATDFVGGAILELDGAISAQLGGNRALRLTDDANISDIVVSTVGSLDNIGSKELASLPYFNTPFPNLALIDIGNEFSQIELDSLKTAGISVLGNNVPRNNIISGEIVSTNKTTDSGIPDETFKFLNAVDTSSVIREFYFNNARARFAQTRLTEGALEPNRAIDNADTIAAFFISTYDSLSGVLTQSGERARNFYIQNLNITIDVLSGQAIVDMKVPIVGQLREIITQMRIVFSTNN